MQRHAERPVAAGDGLLWCAGTTLYYNGKAVPGCTLTDTPKVFAALGGTVLIWPDKIWFRPADGTFGSAEPSWSGSVTLAAADTDGDGRASILVADGAGTDFRTGDAVTLSGFGDVRNNGTYILRGIDGARLRFDPDTFVRAGAVNGVTITRRVPDAQHACSYGNRLWACAHDSVWCTKLGDPLSWFWYEADENGPHTHVWDEGTVTVAPTETTPGVRTYTCTVCGQTRTEIIPATGSAVCPGGAACPSFRFRDVPAPSNWAHEGIDYCVRHGLMSGFDATTFSPDTVSTRAQIVMILYNLSGDTTDYSKYYVPFTDVKPGTWYYNAVAWGYDKDIVAGMTPTTFAPDGLITREQMAVLLYGYTEKYAPAYLGGAASLNGFPDAASVSNWAYAAMSWAVGNGLISGIASDGADYLAPSGGATRAQIAAIMMRYCRLTGL